MTTTAMDPELLKEVEALARSEGRSTADVVRDAMHAYLERRRYLLAIDEGIAAADAGDVVQGEDVDRWLSTW
jgi:predicted transcriptional regulator